MEFKGIEIGLKNEITKVTEAVEGTSHIGGISVFSTPSMLMRMEECCLKATEPFLPEGFATVGVSANLVHMASTMIGDTATSKCELVDIKKGKMLTFEVECFDSKGQIGKCTHVRAIIDTSKFGK